MSVNFLKYYEYESESSRVIGNSFKVFSDMYHAYASGTLF